MFRGKVVLGLSHYRLPSISLRPRCLSSLDAALRYEWLLTNSLGGYASSTSLGVNTRKYHGVLVASLDPPGKRTLFVGKVDEELKINGVNYMLGTNDFVSGLEPQGYRYLSSFSLNPFPSYRYDVWGVELEKTLYMVHGRNASLIEYSVSNHTSADVEVRIYPMISCRHIYSTSSRGDVEWSTLQAREDALLFKPSTKTESLAASFSVGEYYELGRWLENLFYRVDNLRGESSTDAYYIPGFITFDVTPHKKMKLHLLFVVGRDENYAMETLGSIHSEGFSSIIGAERSRLESVLKSFFKRYRSIKVQETLKWLLLSIDSFIVERLSEKSKSIIAGYHWFGEWGRDTFISLPGLTLVTGRFDEAKQILSRYGDLVEDGLMPNFFSDTEPSKPEYSSVDVSLWYVNAVYQYLKYSGDLDYVGERLLPKLQSIISGLLDGGAKGVKCSRGLLIHNSRMTWMDACVDGIPVTPRCGKAVDVQALWYNALKITENLSKRLGLSSEAELYGSLAVEAKNSFLKEFWNDDLDRLYDVVGMDGVDSSVRPNQILAVSLDFSMLDGVKSFKVVDNVWRKLWAVYGLRTLSEDDPNYVGRYEGGWSNRDRAYHNGTVWAWLTGPFVTAFLKVRGYEPHWRKFAYKNFIEPLFTEQVYTFGLGTIGEVFDGDWPHRPDGCISQAWSVAEPFRAYVEDILYVRPPYEGILA